MQSIILLFAAVAAALGTGVDVGWHNSYAAASSSPSPSHARPDPAFTFTLSCSQWRLEYLVDDGELSLWTSCYARQPDPQPAPSAALSASATAPHKGADVYVISRLALDKSYVANAHAIRVASPSDAAPVSFSSLCHDCSLYNDTSSIMTCNCTTNTGRALMSVDLGLNIAGMPNGVPCFTDGAVCAVQQSVSTMTIGATSPTSPATTNATTLATTTLSSPACTQ